MGMRIRSVAADAPNLTSRVLEKQDSTKKEFQQAFKDQQKKDPDENLTDEEKQKKIQDALEEFTASNTLRAQAEGSGPGLKIVLKDGTGAVIRQMTGEEFLKLRETAKSDGQARGKILDQKF